MEQPKVLVINGDKGFRKMLMLALEEDYRVFEAWDRNTAFEHLKEEGPHVVLMELFVPPRSDYVDEGFTILKKIKETIPDVKIIVVTTIEDREIIAKTRELGADDYIVKPFKLEDLKRAVKEAISKPTPPGVKPIPKGIERRKYWRDEHGRPMEIEGRRLWRVACGVPISYSLHQQKKKAKSRKSKTLNLSSGGVMFPISQPITPHNLLDIDLFLPPSSFYHTSGVAVKAVGEARWVRKVKGKKIYNLGVQFFQISDENREKIANYIYTYEHRIED